MSSCVPKIKLHTIPIIIIAREIPKKIFFVTYKVNNLVVSVILFGKFPICKGAFETAFV